MTCLLAYAAIGLVVAVLAAAESSRTFETRDRLGCGIFGLAFGAIWPITLLGISIGYAGTALARCLR